MSLALSAKLLRRAPYWIGAALVVIFFGVALLAPSLAAYPPDHIDLVASLQPPSAAHWLGTDENGADVLSQIIHGSRIAAQVGLGVVSLCAFIGIIFGSLSGYYGGLIDEVMMRIIDVLMAFPGILLAILIIAITRSPSISSVIFALSLTGWAGYARLVRGQILSLKTRPFVTAARAMGARDLWIIRRHLLPNVMTPVIVQATFGVAGAILAEAGLSFLGLGPDGAPSWGALLDQGARYFLISPHLAIAPGIAIVLVVLGVNLMGDHLRDHFDPKINS